MHKFSQFLITLPILVLPLTALAAKPAFAETVGIEHALELLAKSTVIDGKCNILTISERDELSTYVAKAEVAAAEKMSLGVIRSAFSAGKKQGQIAPCSSEVSSEVKETLRAAREAIRSATQDTGIAPQPAVTIMAPAPKGGLSAYSRIIETYFLERRCTYLSRRKMNSFYKAVVRGHRVMISEFGKAAVSKIMKSAEARSNYQSCNGVGEARVKASFAEIASR